MELMLIVYLVGLISNLSTLLGWTMVVLIAMAVFGILFVFDEDIEGEREDRLEFYMKKLFFPKIFVTLVLLFWLAPNEQTMKYMAGAYLIQSTYESNIVQKGLPLMEKTVLNTLESWAEDAPELKVLLEKTEVVK